MHRAGIIASAAMLSGAAAMLAGAVGPARAQLRTIDPNQTIDQDLSTAKRSAAVRSAAAARARSAQAVDTAVDADAPTAEPTAKPTADQGDPRVQPGTPYRPSGSQPTVAQSSEPAADQRADATRGADATFHRDDLIGAGEGVFGKGAQGFAGIIEKILKGQGEPNAYVAGREASGAVVVGLRYGSGIMTHRIEGQMPVYWTGPSVGFDLGGDANKVFVLVYNLYDTAEIYHRFPQVEGHLYAVGGFSASYLRWGHVVVIPVRLGVGWRAGVNVGYMKFSRKSKWLPF